MELIYKFADAFLQILGGLSVIAGIIKLVYETIIYFKKKRHMKKLLMFNNGECYVSLAIYKKEVTGADYDYVTTQEMNCFQEVQYMLSKINYKTIPYNFDYAGCNIIHISGPSANDNVNSILLAKHYNFKIFLPKENAERLRKLGVDISRYIFTENGDYKFQIGESELVLNNTKDYGVFIRIPFSKEDGIDYTTHIIFGGWAKGTEAAVKFFTQNYKMIVEKFNKDRYCFAIELNRSNYSIELLRKSDIIDLTTEFFKNTSHDDESNLNCVP